MASRTRAAPRTAREGGRKMRFALPRTVLSRALLILSCVQGTDNEMGSRSRGSNRLPSTSGQVVPDAESGSDGYGFDLDEMVFRNQTAEYAVSQTSSCSDQALSKSLSGRQQGPRRCDTVAVRCATMLTH